jgi:plasmid maintenance system antidote protein VapI
MLPETITIKDAATRWDCSEKTIRRAISEKSLLTYGRGKRLHIDIESGDEWWKASANIQRINRRRVK